MTAIALSSGHGLYVRGASGLIDEVDEARRVCHRLALDLRRMGVTVHGPFNDDTSEDQQTNLETIVGWHNAQSRSLDVSVHFNANQATDDPVGTECLYLTAQQTASDVARAVADFGDLKNRGAKFRDDLYFLNNTDEAAILIEVCFVDSEADVDAYEDHFREICAAIAQALEPLTV